MSDLQFQADDGHPHTGIKDALRQLRQTLEKVFEGGDPMPGFSNEADPFGRTAFEVKLDLRAQRELSVALHKGDLSAKAVADGRQKTLPRWAWGQPSYVRHCLVDGKLRLSPLLPPEWQEWTCLPVFLDCAEFDAWASSLTDFDPPPGDSRAADEEAVDSPPFVTERALRLVPMVGLTEAATWAAFYIAMDSYELGLIEDAGEVSGIVNPRFPSAAKGVAAMLEAGSGLSPKLDIFGRHTANFYNDSAVGDMQRIPSTNLASYGEPVWHRNGLRWAPHYDPTADHDPLAELFKERDDGWHDVQVDRAQLLTVFPPAEQPQRLRKSHEDIVKWCGRWIKSGKGNGMDKAWTDFQADPESVGLSRDDVFRPAWREAKTR